MSSQSTPSTTSTPRTEPAAFVAELRRETAGPADQSMALVVHPLLGTPPPRSNDVRRAARPRAANLQSLPADILLHMAEREGIAHELVGTSKTLFDKVGLDLAILQCQARRGAQSQARALLEGVDKRWAKIVAKEFSRPTPGGVEGESRRMDSFLAWLRDKPRLLRAGRIQVQVRASQPFGSPSWQSRFLARCPGREPFEAAFDELSADIVRMIGSAPQDDRGGRGALGMAPGPLQDAAFRGIDELIQLLLSVLPEAMHEPWLAYARLVNPAAASRS